MSLVVLGVLVAVCCVLLSSFSIIALYASYASSASSASAVKPNYSMNGQWHFVSSLHNGSSTGMTTGPTLTILDNGPTIVVSSNAGSSGPLTFAVSNRSPSDFTASQPFGAIISSKDYKNLVFLDHLDASNYSKMS